MENPAPPPSGGRYTANVIGNIRGHLAGLQGFDVMALELIQNADDAGAKRISFDIQDDGLAVENSGAFTYCGDLASDCAFVEDSNYSCDFHRVVDVGSGGKLARSENIGRFGIGFVSTYQVTDEPLISSSGIAIRLQPHKGDWLYEAANPVDGTRFFLPWATNPKSPTRLALGASAIGTQHIEQLEHDVKDVLGRSLLFLRHVQEAEVRRNGKLVTRCVIDRTAGDEITLRFDPEGTVEKWLMLRADASKPAEKVRHRFPILEMFGRGTKVTMAYRLSPEPIGEGLLYAFLPTEQSSGVPLHINADFFPESDRKALIFAGGQHAEAWNAMLLETAAEALARDPEDLGRRIGIGPLWELLARSMTLAGRSNVHACFKSFWARFQETATATRIVTTMGGTIQPPSAVLIPQISLGDPQVSALKELGAHLPTADLRRYQNAMLALGAQALSLAQFVGLLERAVSHQFQPEQTPAPDRRKHFFVPLWGVANELLRESASGVAATENRARLAKVPFLLSEDGYLVRLNQTYVAPVFPGPSAAADVLPAMAIAASELASFSRIAIPDLSLTHVVQHLEAMAANGRLGQALVSSAPALRTLYGLFAELDRTGPPSPDLYSRLGALPIWLTNQGFRRADVVLLPGSFPDPTGSAPIIHADTLTEQSTSFLSTRLKIPRESIVNFALRVVPSAFTPEGPHRNVNYPQLMLVLSNHLELLDHDEVRQLLGSLPLVPTQDGGWAAPTLVYRRTDDLQRVLGDSPERWLDLDRIPHQRGVHLLLEGLGLRMAPHPQHLADRVLSIAARHLPDESWRRSSEEAFYALCDAYAAGQERDVVAQAIARLRGSACFPIDGDDGRWHSAGTIYAPYRSEAFRSQAKILSFRNTGRLQTPVLTELGIRDNPETELVIQHLQHCIELGRQPHVTVYQVLNEAAQRGEVSIQALVGTRCIYVDGRFVRPSQLYWMRQNFGAYTYTIPERYEAFRPLFNALGVNDAPDASALIDILLDLVGQHYETSRPLEGTERAVYDACVATLAIAYEKDELSADETQRLSESPVIQNLKGFLCHPDEILLQDSEWLAAFFSGGLDQALTRPPPEYWGLLSTIGMKRLSESAEVVLYKVDGPPNEEHALAETLAERVGLVGRLLQDQPARLRSSIRIALENLTAVSHEVVQIQATVEIDGRPFSAPPVATLAYFHAESLELHLTRPAGAQGWRWPHILNALFHQLMPEASGPEVSKLTLNVLSILSMSLDEAHERLTDSGFPEDQFVENDGSDDGLQSPELEEFPAFELEPVVVQETAALVPSDKPEGTGNEAIIAREGKNPEDHEGGSTHASGAQHGARAGAETPAMGERSRAQRARGRPKHKEQWDRRLISYVRQRSEGDGDEGAQGSNAHNLAIEAVARGAVCEFEKERGRVPEQMPQTHPGYDILSSSTAGEARFIEVKGLRGEWNQTGVGLSSLQFKTSLDRGDQFWLYVVEFASDPERMRIHPIQNPAEKVTHFMFDGAWRDVADQERADPTAGFVPGARVDHQDMGVGSIVSVTSRGMTKVLEIKFDDKAHSTPNVSLNIYRMRVIEADHGDHLS